jgi:flagellar basal-body rod modification protein FlgD
MSAIGTSLFSPSSVTGSVANANSTTSGGSSSGSTSQTAVDPLASEQTFLKLLVAQIKNQDPTSPTDPIQFVSQLTQYSELEQLIGINTGVKGLNTAVTPTTTNKTTTPTT